MTKPPKCSGSSNPSVDFITYMHNLREGAAKIKASVRTVETCFINCDDGLSVWRARECLMQNFSLFSRKGDIKVGSSF